MSRTPLMLVAALAAGAASTTTAGAGGCGGNCYRQEYVAPSYRTVAERVLVRAPRTYSQVIPAQYGYVNETVQVSAAQRYWTYKYDGYGRKVKCLVEAPARFAQVSRRVMVRGPEVVPQYVPAAYATRQYTVQDQPGYKTWVPVGGGGYRSAGYGGGYGASAGYGGGYGASSGYGSGGGGGYGRASYGGGYASGASSYGYARGSSGGGGYGGGSYGGGGYGGGYGSSSYGGGGLVGAAAGIGFGAAGAGLGVLGGGYGEY